MLGSPVVVSPVLGSSVVAGSEVPVEDDGPAEDDIVVVSLATDVGLPLDGPPSEPLDVPSPEAGPTSLKQPTERARQAKEERQPIRTKQRLAQNPRKSHAAATGCFLETVQR